MEWGVGASQQKTKHIPPNTHYNLSNQLLDFKFFLVEPSILSDSKNIQLDPSFVYPSNRNFPLHEWSPEKLQSPQKLSGIKRIKIVFLKLWLLTADNIYYY
jgi:hypothetical protein